MKKIGQSVIVVNFFVPQEHIIAEFVKDVFGKVFSIFHTILMFRTSLFTFKDQLEYQERINHDSLFSISEKH